MTDLRKAAEMALEAMETLWDILDDIDTASDMAKENDAWYRKRVEALQKKRWDTTITTDGYKLKGGPVEALRQALAQPVQVLTAKVVVTGIEHESWCDSVTKLLLSMPPQIPPCNCKLKNEQGNSRPNYPISESSTSLDKIVEIAIQGHASTRDAIRWAMQQEREACAKLVEADGLARGDEGLVLIKAAGRIRARSEKPPVKSYCGGKPNYCTSDPHVDTVNTSQARVEYDRQGNIAQLFGPIEPDGTLLYTAPPKRECVDAVNMSQERVDETAKREHEPVAWINYNAATGEETINRDCHSELGSTPLYKTPPSIEAAVLAKPEKTNQCGESCEWVGLTEDEIQETGQYSYCRGGTSKKLYHIMWNSQPSASVGWCREELIAFAQTIEAKLKEKNR